MREELEQDHMVHAQYISNENSVKRHDIQSFDEIIRSVPLSDPKKALSNSMIEKQALRNQLLNDQNMLSALKNRFHNMSEKSVNQMQDRITLKSGNKWNDDSSISKVDHTPKVKKDQTPKVQVIEDDM